MHRLVPLDGARTLEVQSAWTGRVAKYHRQGDGTVHVDNPMHAKAMLAEGVAHTAATAGPSAHLRGYRCGCGRRNYFKSCGACGSADGIKETL